VGVPQTRLDATLSHLVEVRPHRRSGMEDETCVEGALPHRVHYEVITALLHSAIKCFLFSCARPYTASPPRTQQPW
jgi:hypothetical protein